MALEDIEVYKSHKLNLENHVARIEYQLDKAGRRPTLSESAKLCDLREAIKEYQEDIDRLNEKLSDL